MNSRLRGEKGNEPTFGRKCGEDRPLRRNGCGPGRAAERSGQLGTEVSRQLAHGPGDNRRISSWRTARSSQAGIAPGYWFVSVRSSDSPLGGQRATPVGIHIELMYSDENFYAFPVTLGLGEMNRV